MFQFTTTNVINSTQDLTTGMPLWSVQTRTLEDGSAKTLYLKRIGKFDEENVTHVYKAEATDPVNAKAKIKMDDIESEMEEVKSGDMFRLNMYVRLSEGSANSLYANDTYYKGKPFVVDFTYDGNWKTTVEKLVKVIKKYDLAVHGEAIVKVDYKDSTLLIDAINEYQRFAKVVIEHVIPEANHGLGDVKEVLVVPVVGPYETIEDTEAEFESKETAIMQGEEGFGTYSYLLHNLRLPTTTRFGYKAINEEETPHMGAKYTQFTIHYCVNRGTLGMNAVGDQVTSHTTHVLYVNNALLESTPEGNLPEDSEESTWSTSTLEDALAAIAGDKGIETIKRKGITKE